ncbi:RES domain-containing protein [Halomonas sp. I5-271120]|uniref:RES domain-containing protein n=1 Tax=Halomonas sp. I5-271120 TaxID=3061632 RepID=UPI002714D618|nr:RES domain-containing protein [Halomonas sp. I5-271120]
MKSYEEVQGIKIKIICSGCVGESFLSSCVEDEGRQGKCEYCEEEGIVVCLEELSEHIDRAFENHYARTSNEPDSWQYAMLKDKEMDYDWEREGEPTIYAVMNAAEIPEEAASDVQAILEDQYECMDSAAMGEECEYESQAHYEEIMPGDEGWQEGWRRFERTIKSEARFFNRESASQLGELFNAVDEMRDIDGKPLVVDAGPGAELTHLYRARVFQSDDKLQAAMIRPDKELGAPPSVFASAGRMNARGISVFYGATSVDTALAEVRPPVGSQVAVARFDIVTPIRLLDLSALSRVHERGSIFDPSYAYRLSRTIFLKKLSNRMAYPVMPDDKESEYLSTQAIADFLATEGEVPLDGIIFPSVQIGRSGLNVVLFHKASKCREMEFPKGAEFWASTYLSTEDGPEPDYSVVERVPQQSGGFDDRKGVDVFGVSRIGMMDGSELDERGDTLEVDVESIEIHVVNAISIGASSHRVRRTRY